jgi:hypothetical protein
MKAHAIAVSICQAMDKQMEEEPIEVFLAFAGLFCSMGVKMNVPAQDAINLIRNVYMDVSADAQREIH